MTEILKIRPADYDAFRIDLFDVPEQACTGDIECAVEDILRGVLG